jgi:hypothetical protein
MARRALTHAHVSMTSGYATRHRQLRCRHTSRGISSHLLAHGSSGAATCPMAPAPESGSWQLGCCHAFCGTNSRLLAQGSSRAAMCLVAPPPASWLTTALEPPHVSWIQLSSPGSGPQQDNIGSLATHSRPLQCSTDLLPTHDGQLQCRVTRQPNVVPRMHATW